MTRRAVGCLAAIALILASAGAIMVRAQAPQPPGPDACALQADRGIGGTGIGSDIRPVALADLGVVGPITRLPNPCVAGVPIDLAGATVRIDDTPATTAALRVGEVAAVAGRADTLGLHADSVAVRHEVVGPVESVASDGTSLVVAGQAVRRDPQTIVTVTVAPGTWVAVSGLRDAAGSIHATRIDPASPGLVLVAGQPARDAEAWHLGALRLDWPESLAADGRLVLRGRLVGGELSVTAALRLTQPTDGLPPERLLVEGFADTSDGQVAVAGVVSGRVTPDFGAAPPPDMPSVVDFHAGAGGLRAVGWHPAPAVVAAARSGAATPAPVVAVSAVPATAPAPAPGTVAPAAAAAPAGPAPAAAGSAPPAGSEAGVASPAPPASAPPTTAPAVAPVARAAPARHSPQPHETHAASTTSKGDASGGHASGSHASGSHPSAGTTSGSGKTAGGSETGSHAGHAEGHSEGHAGGSGGSGGHGHGHGR